MPLASEGQPQRYLGESKMIGIYKITNTLNNKSYIGQSKNILSRWDDHIESLKNSNKSWYPLARQESNSISDFSFSILKLCNIDDLDKYEAYYINKFNTFNKGYNFTYNGKCNKNSKYIELFDLLPMKNIQDIEAYKEKMSHLAFLLWEYLYNRRSYKTFPYAPEMAAKQLKISVNDYLIALDELINLQFIEETLDGFTITP